ncbi:DUF2243 domain-containing protein [Micromonospora sp. WMMA1923]|uniref:DUF2243 domain-containing protein n=1 Tax=Micromonospora sp. WMMA1923 TaxID=3404125 RepID=UPI003B92CDF5
MADSTPDAADIRLPATVLGVGLGGFVDGILLHQVRQWHAQRAVAGGPAERVNAAGPRVSA